MQDSNKELIVKTDDGMNVNFVDQLSKTENSFLSLFAKNKEPKPSALYNAIQSPDKGAGDVVNTTFTLTGVVCHTVQITNTETGEIMTLPRLIMFTDKGTFGSVSLTLFSSIKNLLAVYGNLTTTNGIKVTLKQTNKGDKRYYSLIVEE